MRERARIADHELRRMEKLVIEFHVEFLASEVSTTADELVVHLRDGRTIIVPLAWYPRLLNATEEQRRDLRILGDGEYIHWPQVDEDLSVSGLLRGTPAPRR